MKNSITLYVAILLLLIPFEDYAQSWTKQINTAQNDETLSSVNMLKNGDLIFTGILYHQDQNRSIALIHTDVSGKEQKNYKEISSIGEINLFSINNVFEDGDSLIFIGDGYRSTDKTMAIVFIKTDIFFNTGTINIVLSDLPKPTVGYGSLLGAFTKKNEKGYYGCTNTDSNNIEYRLYYQLSTEGKLLYQSVVTDPVFEMFSLLTYTQYDPNNGGYFTLSADKVGYEMDSVFDIKKTYYPVFNPDPHFIRAGANTISDFENGYIVSGQYGMEKDEDARYNIHTIYGWTDIKLYNADLSVIKTKRIYLPDSISGFTPGINNFDYNNPNELFFAFYNPGKTVDDTLNQTITVFKTDSNFNIFWMNTKKCLVPGINLQSIKAISDGGCILTGFSDSGNNKDMFLLKFDKTGFVSGLKDLKMEMAQITVYPNPGGDKITIDSKTPTLEFVLYDMQGKLVLNTSQSEINTEMLKNGIYFYRLSDGTDFVKTGKWIKK